MISYVFKNTILSYKNESIFSYLPYEPFVGDINVKVDLSNYPQKQILKTFHMLILQVLH